MPPPPLPPSSTPLVCAVAQHTPESAMEAEVAELLQAAGASTARAVAESEDKLAMKVCWCVVHDGAGHPRGAGCVC